MQSYVDVLIKSLESKIQILEEIHLKNNEQAELAKKVPFEAKDFDANTEAKGLLIERLNQLDGGFDQIYNRIRVELMEHKDEYHAEIAQMKVLISKITDLSVTIQAEEARNKVAVEKAFFEERKKNKTARKASKASLDYYLNMNRTNYVDPQFMDQHK